MTRGAVPPSSRRERRAQQRLERPAPARRRATRSGTRPVWQSPVVLVTATAILIGIAIIAFARPPARVTGADLITPPTSYPANLIDGESLGAATAPVVLELYSDFQCPACKQFVTLQLPRLVTEFVTPGSLRIEARDINLLGKGSVNESLELAAGAACAAAQGRYWQFHDYVFWNQGRENRGDHDAAFIAAVADAVGVNRTDWDTCFARPETRTPITARTTAAFAAGINSTPTLVVNGQKFAGVPNYDQLATLIRQLAGPAPSPSPS
jgi:protein-disulfide isomerase